MHLCFSGLVGWSVLCTCVFLGELLECIVHLCFSELVGWSVLCTCVFLG